MGNWLRSMLPGFVSSPRVTLDPGTFSIKLLSTAPRPGRRPPFHTLRRDREPVRVDGPGAPQPEDYRAPLSRLRERSGLGEDTSVVLGLPLRSCIVRPLRIPTESPSRLDAAVRRRAKSILAFPPQEVRLDYRLVQRNENNIRVLLIMVQREKLGRYLDVVREVGWRPEGVDVSALGLFELFRYVREDAAPTRPRNPGTSVLVDWGHANTDLLAVEDGELRYARSLARGTASVMRSLGGKPVRDPPGGPLEGIKSVDLMEGWEGPTSSPGEADPPGGSFEVPPGGSILSPRGATGSDEPVAVSAGEAARKAVDGWVVELERTFEYLVDEVEASPVGSLWLCGGGSRFGGVTDYLQSRLDCPCFRFDPTGSPDGMFPEGGAAHLAGLGLHLRAEAGSGTADINLLPDETAREQRRGSRRRSRRTAAVLAGLLLLQGLLIFLMSAVRWQNWRAASDGMLGEVAPLVQRVETLRERRDSLRRRVQKLARLRRDRVPILSVLSDLSRLPRSLRRDSWIRAIHYRGGTPHGTLKVAGVTRDFQRVSRFYAWMEDRPYVVSQLHEQQTRSEYRRDARPVSLVRFRVSYAVDFSTNAAAPRYPAASTSVPGPGPEASSR